MSEEMQRIANDIRKLVDNPEIKQIDLDISTADADIIHFIRNLFDQEYPDWYEHSDFYEQDTLVFRREEDE